jgi:hypothetical protein
MANYSFFKRNILNAGQKKKMRLIGPPNTHIVLVKLNFCRPPYNHQLRPTLHLHMLHYTIGFFVESGTDGGVLI